MTKDKLPTINLKGKEYVQVKDRVKHFNEEYKDGSIKTEVVHQSDAFVAFKATVTPDIASPEKCYTGHSFGTLKDVKAFEKLETVAAGRALAFMGIGIIESVASADEMDRYHNNITTQEDNEKEELRFNEGIQGEILEPTQKGKSKMWIKEQIAEVVKYEFCIRSGISKRGNKYYMLDDWSGQAAYINEPQYDYLKSQFLKQ
jgi:hypothetical protein